jgi:hypothetical protein
VTMNHEVFWGVVLCRSCVNRRFKGTYRLHLQGRKNPRTRNQRKQVAAQTFICSHLLTLVSRSRIFSGYCGLPGTLVSGIALHSRRARFESPTENRLSWLNFSRFFSVPTCKCRDNASIRTWPLPPTAFPIHQSPILLAFNAVGSEHRQCPKLTQKNYRGLFT